MRNGGDDIALTQEERASMRRTIHAYMEMKPLRTLSASRSSVSAFPWLHMYYRPFAAVLVLGLFVSSAGVSYAAQQALPGDLLYPIKTNVDEPIQGALALSASAKTEWAMAVAGDRIEEAATLAAEGRLDPSTQAALQQNFQEHAAIAENNIAQEASTSPETGAETATRFGAQLSEYQRVLTDVGDSQHVTVAPLASSVQNVNARIATIGARAETLVANDGNSDNAIAASRMQSAAQEGLGISLRLARRSSSAFAPSSASDISADLADASTTISQGNALLDDDSTSGALGAFKSALAATEKLGVFLQTSSAIHARTGLVIGQPNSGNAATSTRSSGKTSGHGGAQGKVRTAAAMAPTGAMAPDTGATSSTQSGDEGNQNDDTVSGSARASVTNSGSSQEDNEGEQNQNSSSNQSQVLPLSVPTFLSQ